MKSKSLATVAGIMALGVAAGVAFVFLARSPPNEAPSASRAPPNDPVERVDRAPPRAEPGRDADIAQEGYENFPSFEEPLAMRVQSRIHDRMLFLERKREENLAELTARLALSETQAAAVRDRLAARDGLDLEIQRGTLEQGLSEADLYALKERHDAMRGAVFLSDILDDEQATAYAAYLEETRSAEEADLAKHRQATEQYRKMFESYRNR